MSTKWINICKNYHATTKTPNTKALSTILKLSNGLQNKYLFLTSSLWNICEGNICDWEYHKIMTLISLHQKRAKFVSLEGGHCQPSGPSPRSLDWLQNPISFCTAKVAKILFCLPIPVETELKSVTIA